MIGTSYILLMHIIWSDVHSTKVATQPIKEVRVLQAIEIIYLHVCQLALVQSSLIMLRYTTLTTTKAIMY